MGNTSSTLDLKVLIDSNMGNTNYDILLLPLQGIYIEFPIPYR